MSCLTKVVTSTYQSFCKEPAVRDTCYCEKHLREFKLTNLRDFISQTIVDADKERKIRRTVNFVSKMVPDMLEEYRTVQQAWTSKGADGLTECLVRVEGKLRA